MKAITLWQPATKGEFAAYCAGVLKGDGWCTDLTLGLRSNDREFTECFAEAVNAATGITVAQPRIDERGYWLFRAGNRSGRFSWLTAVSPRTKREKKMWLRGLFDSEGNANLCRSKMSVNSFSRRIAFYSTDRQTLLTADRLLGDFGFATCLRITKNSSSHKGTKVVFELRLTHGFDNFKKFAAVGSSIARKMAIIVAIPTSYQADNSYCSRGGKAGCRTRWGKKERES